MVEHLGDEIDFHIVTSDRDALDSQPYPNVTRDAWQSVGKARVYYASPATQTLADMTAVLQSVDYDILYLNSFFDSRFTILPLLARRLGRLRRKPVVVAPRGEFSRGALAIRSWKKRPYTLIARLAGLYAGVTWHASSEFERTDIVRIMGERAGTATRVAVNLPHKEERDTPAGWRPRQPGDPLRIVFLSRISPMKNLDYALRSLATTSKPVSFDIFGMVDDQGYWMRCQALIARMPANVRAVYHGPLPHEKVADTLAKYDVFFLPSLGENYGHAIAESLTQGTPVLISDHTPWRDLQKRGVGWDLPLEESGLPFREAIESLAAMPPDEYVSMRRRVAEYGKQRLGSPEVVEANRRLFAAGRKE
jgi:glycosyltransferase involved in cell wall biosynthesis